MRFRLLGHLILLAFAALAATARAETEAPPQPEPGATAVTADRISGRSDVETIGDGNAEFRRDDTTITADRLIYRHLEDEAEADGNVRFQRGEDFISGDHLRLRVQDNLGAFEQPHFSFQKPQPEPKPGQPPQRPLIGSGDAERMEFEGEGLYRLTRSTFSTCSPNRDWYVAADQITLDYNREVGEADSATVVFKDTAIFYWPSLSFALNNQRKSGFLSPSYGTTSTSGVTLLVPWYWNIAPNMDAVIAPRILTRRGTQLNSEFRYLDHAYRGETRLEYLPSDRLTGTDRHAYAIKHSHSLYPGLNADINLNGVSDDTYFDDLSSRVAMVSQANLVRQGVLSYGGGWWGASLMAQRFQTLQDPDAPVAIPYYRLPQFKLTALRPDLPGGFHLGFSGEYVDFHHPTLLTGQRAMYYPQLSLPMQTAAFFLTPKIGYHVTRYQLDRDAGSTEPTTLSREVPIMSVDSGLVFEREAQWFGRSLTQTAEPRLFYVKIPGRDQSDIPVFDSALADFNFAQIFSENRYGGADRIGDASQLTAALVSRLIDPDNGAELVRAAVGQRFYFEDQQVTLPGETPRTNRKTDILAAFSGRILPRVHLDTGWQYSQYLDRTIRFNIGARYQPEFGKVLNVGYRYTRELVDQVDISGQWPIGGGWYGVARYNYSFTDNRLVEGVAGVEYDAGCWVARIVAHRLATTADKTSTTLFFQLELNGLARIGSNPIDILKRNITGYGVINEPTADPVFGEN